MVRMAWRTRALLLAVPLLLCSWAVGAKAACCTNGQPSYEDSKYQGKFPIPTCSDGPCSGEGFSYAGGGAYESPNPLSCCDMENLGQFKYNPQDGSGKYWPWPNDKHFPEFLEGTGQPCDPEAVRFRCKLGGHETSEAESACSADEVENGGCAAP